MMTKPLYIVPARGGSRGIPRKNIRKLCGKPLIQYTLDAALTSSRKTGGYILVSTDDEEIADVARACGVPVEYMRPTELGGDNIGSREVMLHAMDWADSKGIEYDCVVLLQPTSPMRTAADISAALDAYVSDGHADMAVTVCASDANPYYNLFETQADGTLHVCKGDGLLTRRQDAPPVWQYNGAVYVIRPASLRAMPLGMFPRRIPVEMDASRSIDLDTPADWHRAENVLNTTDF